MISIHTMRTFISMLAGLLVAGSALAATPPSFVRVNTTSQSWNPAQPWEKTPPRTRSALAVLVAPGQVLTTAEMAADATFIEFKSLDGTRQATAKTIAVDYEANLALLGLAERQQNGGAKFFDGMQPVKLAADPKVGDQVEAVQVEENGRTLFTRGTIQGVDVVSTFLPEQFFLIFQVKASMQSASSSYTLPVMREGKLAGILTSYDAKDQLSDVTATCIVRRFLAEAADGDYTGFPSLGVSISRTEDIEFRRWLKLPDTEGGLYVSKIRKDGAAAKAGIRKGDVMLAIDGARIDRRGYYVDPQYGPLFWSHLIRGSKKVGDQVKISLWREGQKTEVTATLARRDEAKELVPAYQFGRAPNFLVKGGMIFQELSRPLLEAFGDDWQSQAPLNLLEPRLNPEKYEQDCDRIVFLSGVIPTPATFGYEQLRNLIVKQVNGQPVRDMKSLVEAFGKPVDGLNSIRFDDEELTIQLDETAANEVDKLLLKRGIPRLSRTDGK